MFRTFRALGLCFMLSACASTNSKVKAVKLTESDISMFGTKQFEADENKLFEAVKRALVILGYEVSYEDRKMGEVITVIKTYSLTGSFSGIISFNARFNPVGLRYFAKIEKVKGNLHKVVLKPEKFSSTYNVSDQPIWILDGEFSEKRLWQKFFEEVEARLKK